VNLARLEAFCGTLPQVRSDVKWGADLCYTIDAKMFAVFGIHDGKPANLGFKCDPERFLELTDQAGIIPAPYLARAHWVLVEDAKALADADAKALVRRSYELIVAKLPKRRQRELLG
jgi:predicted DNA-binding protein (MmcQ/YjbR family)